MKTTKDELRRTLKIRLAQNDGAAEKSAIIADKLLKSEAYVRAESVCVYRSFGTEVRTDAIIEQAVFDGKKLYLPRIEGDTILTALWDGSYGLEKNGWGISEPPAARCGDNEFELCVMPLLGFSEKTERLGRGKGYYDRFLKGRDCAKIALAFELQRIEAGFGESHDIKPDMIITEAEIYSAGGK